ncbi:MAG: phosphoglycolate phosphatase [Candidatus Marinimicrobia bacterium]|nr:phosphoglycolate phosphatase [Candidatus Neomarinimicrobiota bacterium]
MTKSKFQAILFDLDGTLVDSSRDITTSINLTLKHLGYDPITLKQSNSFVGDGIRMLVKRALGKSIYNDERHIIEHDLLSEADKIYRKYYAQHVLDTTLPYPGVVDTLSRIAGLQLAVISNKALVYVNEIIIHFQLDKYFRLILGGDSLELKKPDPYPLLYVAQQFNIDPQQCLMVGDSEKDIIAGKAAGMNTCAVTYGMRTEKSLKEQQPDYILSDFQSINSIIR